MPFTSKNKIQLTRRQALQGAITGIVGTTLAQNALSCPSNAPRVPGPHTYVGDHHGKPTFFCNGKPYTKPAFETYVPDARYFHQFTEAGTDIFCFSTNLGAGFSRPVWTGPDQWDFSTLDKNAHLVLAQNANALLMPRIYLSTPTWWIEKHPEECQVLSNGSRTYAQGLGHGRDGKAFPSLLSDRWRQDTGTALRHLIQHMQRSDYGEHLFGYAITGLMSEEWYHWSIHTQQLSDYSIHATLAFRDWLRAKYQTVQALRAAWSDDTIDFDSVTVPSKAARQFHKECTFRDPGQEMAIIDWYLFYNEIVPETIDWFCSAAKQLKQHVTVEHQASTYPGTWNNGASWHLLAQNDFLQGDFYGDALQGSFVRKLLEDLTPNRPFAYETSFSVSLQDHTARKSEALLEAKASAAMADGAAFVFIDAIDPVGTVNARTHRRMAQVFNRLMPYYSHLGGERVADIGVFYSLDSRFDMAQNGRSVVKADNGADTHTYSTMQAARWLIAGHLPFRVVTHKSLNQLSQVKVLVLSNVHHLGEDEAETIRQRVQQGGTLYASGATSLVNKRGQRQADFMLADAFGTSIVKADWSSKEHYLAPTEAGQALFSDWNTKYPAYIKGPGMIVRAHKTATVLATTTLPWRAPDGRAFSSIHSNPPWQATDQPEVVLNQFGLGRVIYTASLLEQSENLKHSFFALMRQLNERFTFEINAHPAVEATLFHQAQRKRYMLSLVNFQHTLPNIPVHGIGVQLHLPHKVRSVTLLPNHQDVAIVKRNRTVQFTVACLETLAMFAIHIDD